MKTTTRFSNLPSLFNYKDNAVQSFESIFDQLLKDSFPEFTNSFGVGLFERYSYPKANIIDKTDKLLIVAEIAGLTKEDVTLTYEEGVLTISGGKRFEDQSKQSGTFICKELKHSSFRRSFSIDASKYKTEEINASFENGLLNIDIPKLELQKGESKTKKIAIK